MSNEDPTTPGNLFLAREHVRGARRVWAQATVALAEAQAAIKIAMEAVAEQHDALLRAEERLDMIEMDEAEGHVSAQASA